MALIAEHIIEQVREANDVVDVVSDYVQLKRSGRNFFGRCPFHNEKTPSFSVSPDKQIYHCFGCGAGGNVINFIMEHERLDFLSSIKLLADRANIHIETDPGEPRKKDDRASIYNMHEIAARVFERQINDANAKSAKDYLLNRGLSEETLKTFRVGFAPDSWDTVTLEVMKLGLSQDVLTRSGLLMPKNEGGYYDRFRNRIMFPIMDINGKVQAFGGRIFGEADGAKYMNSPETPIYHKGRTLFGLNISRDEIRSSRTAILVEGYMDLIRLYQEGFQNVVAGTGTAFTSEQAGLVKRFADKVLVCYDGDAAGQKAAQKAGLTLLDKGLDVRIIQIPEGEDPDSFFDEKDAKAFQKLIGTALDFMTFVLRANQDQMDSPVKRTAFLEGMVSELALMQNEILRGMLAGQLAEEMHVPEEAVMGLLKRQSKRVRRSEYTPDPPARQQQSKPDTLRRPESGAEKAEFELLRLHLSQDESLLNWLTSTIGDEDIKAFHYVEIFQMFHGRLRKELPINHSRLLDEIESAEIRRFIARLINEARPDLESISHAHQCIKTVRWWAIQREMDELKQLMRDADARGEDSQEYFRRKVELQLEQRDIKPNPTPM
ncbi:MAG: DNA primase [Candidatus Marinimicrobia bacterium]|jgi:DNA primase|nr:DNA primase [Candidatus Neomarinimicrobiota bacterium]MBT3575600.1 DNA primase [Candidatus Neomarinimicrobiota bacterium]MBT3681253.1 DNA primase [Candidatus Neomarinimicrobiota bacterium]MBT3950654.1 DNA primase [Candidatus Neomarinimicrobiota bacterium]MBT4253359.1 DNA primase [Candidatus Neomarinimicrobiota bacterium]